MKSSLMRARWAAIGAAVVVSLGGGAVMIASAATSTSPDFVAIEPCRFNDTRGGAAYVGEDGFQEVSMLGQGDFFTLDFSDDGNDGLCNNQLLGVDIDSIVLNVTVDAGTKSSFLTIWPDALFDLDDDDVPAVSSLNWVPLQNFTNAVTVQTDGGTVNFYNQRGDVHVIVDVVGYFTDTTP